ncbi:MULTISPECIES: DUF317 domain-containing protein [unclassified Kitasatospora]|uniref:DUF317 domain-containing protein n=1 Tax=unclassified Kitasatospora TaxID=2633591 RepID=UPI00070E894B|nr:MULTISPECIES: DUF317 domain-containing protein [unclassified Kitasatospora]KQV20905.1 hypothetical protein ASC99_20590 [Kitasatospora sp. Root107]KRB60442.1 hypothetical protein ASE03_12595 [Kitasatospora sp. Root187]
MTIAVTAPTVPGLKPGGPIAHRDWLIGAGSPYEISGFLTAHSWSWVIDPCGTIHAASPDTRVYLGYAPDDPHADTWTVAVTGTACEPGWKAVFDSDAPVELVLDLLTAMHSRTSR